MSRLKQLRKKYGMKAEELAMMLNVSTSYLYDLESGRRRLNEDLIKKLCEIFNVSADFLLELEKKDGCTTGRKIPVIGVVRAGEPIFVEENIIDYIHWDGNRVIDDNYFCLKVTGDSMINAGIKDGDIVLVRKQPVADNGQVVVALIGDEATIKRFYLKNGMVVLKPENDQYEVQVYRPEDVMILGIVVEAKIEME
jgi:repressor LexA